MTLKTLMKKIETANELAQMCRRCGRFRVSMSIDGFCVRELKNHFDWLLTWNDAIEAVKDDWSDDVVESVMNGEIVYGGEPYGCVMPFRIQSLVAVIVVEVEYVE